MARGVPMDLECPWGACASGTPLPADHGMPVGYRCPRGAAGCRGVGVSPNRCTHRQRPALGECLARLAAAMPVAFLEPQLNEFNPCSVYSTKSPRERASEWGRVPLCLPPTPVCPRVPGAVPSHPSRMSPGCPPSPLWGMPSAPHNCSSFRVPHGPSYLHLWGTLMPPPMAPALGHPHISKVPLVPTLESPPHLCCPSHLSLPAPRPPDTPKSPQLWGTLMHPNTSILPLVPKSPHSPPSLGQCCIPTAPPKFSLLWGSPSPSPWGPCPPLLPSPCSRSPGAS